MNRPDFATAPAGWVPEVRYDLAESSDAELIRRGIANPIKDKYVGLDVLNSYALCDAVCALIELSMKWKYRPKRARSATPPRTADDPWL